MGFEQAAISDSLSGADQHRDQAAMNQYWAVQNLLDVKPPDINDMRVALEQLVQQGILDPEMAETFLQEASQFANIDPDLKDSQMGALRNLEDVVSSQGFDAQSKAALHDLQGQIGSRERGQREAILQNAAARGISGSGLEMASQLQNQQGSATSLANQGFQAAADANQRKLQVIQGVGQLGGQIQGQEAQKAAAQDAINQFNSANRQNIENQNTGWRNDASAQNLAEQQRIADQNVGITNQEELYNKNLYQQNYQNELARAQSLSNANLGAGQGQTALGESDPYTKVLSGNAAKWSDENLKTEITEFDSQEFLDGLTGHKYKYVNEDRHGKGPQVGVMAQDLEKVLPEAVDNYEEGKAINFTKLGGPILASLAGLNDRISDIEGGD